MGILFWVGVILITMAIVGAISRGLRWQATLTVAVVGVVLAALQIVQNAATNRSPSPPSSPPPSPSPPTPVPHHTSSPTSNGSASPTATETTSPTPKESLEPAPPSQQLLDALQPTDYDPLLPLATSATVNGHVFPNSLIMSPEISSHRQATATYAIARQYRAFRATVGIDDGAPSTFAAKVAVYADGRIVYSRVVRKGGIFGINVRVMNVYNLQLAATGAGPQPGFGSDFAAMKVVFGDATLLK